MEEFTYCPMIKDKCKGNACVLWNGEPLLDGCEMTMAFISLKQVSNRLADLRAKLDYIVEAVQR